MGYMMADEKQKAKVKTGKTGKRGIPVVDKVQDYDFFIDEYVDESGKKHRIGHATMAHQTNNALSRIAPELKISKSGLIRKILESFIKYHDEAKAIGGERFFQAEIPLEGWINERMDMALLLKSMISKDLLMQENTKNPEVLMMSQQLTQLARMMNLTHKNLL